jgi:hypothetical protein
MRVAFKEWAIVVDALARGEQIIILRKGGISEGRRGFQVDYAKFLLFPTRFHQQRDSVLPSAQTRFDQIAPNFPDPNTLRLECFAEVVAWRRLDSLAAAERLRGQHIWRDALIADRFDWGQEKNIHAMALRVYRLGFAVELPLLADYGGCKSWIELANDIETQDATPILSAEDFETRLKRFEAALDLQAPAE